MDDAGLSPEQMGDRMGLSGMTIRRWRDPKNRNRPLPKLYENALIGVTQQLIAEDKIKPDAASIVDVRLSGWEPFDNAAARMGCSLDQLKEWEAKPEAAIETLSHIGLDVTRKDIVDKNTTLINSFRKKSDDWKSRISQLFTVLNSKSLTSMDKLVAYGAFFYLLNPFDFIPDSIPVFGLLDDFFILGIAAAYYLKRYPHLFPKQRPPSQ